ncbi:hypothetical protein crov510 [Cafeteria roenbergensis virus]|uniref:Uncharacterized protein n=1 Tax=Cafeteria roenbergensis virus (strain BV-PW1) TaxID=693272 RepID=E3T5T1_CROVB|nr:hypothetical protein crov510 [Cafeteria roenbergensis virus BV-PW1]ADO67544.1 hypothetical protein crov510 [Cafeteria roenbergensis virus BV-PW1]
MGYNFVFYYIMIKITIRFIYHKVTASRLQVIPLNTHIMKTYRHLYTFPIKARYLPFATSDLPGTL